MALVDPAKIRNMAVVGHRGAGKTSLVEALLFTSGAKNRLGNVTDGTTTMDHDEDEISRQMTISSGLAHVEWNKHKFNLIDTPGEASFINDALGALAVVESAFMVVNTVAKVEVQTERLWKLAAELGVARMAVLNMMDRERAVFDEAVDALQDRFGDGVVPGGPAHRQGGRLQGCRRPSHHEGVHCMRTLPARAKSRRSPPNSLRRSRRPGRG